MSNEKTHGQRIAEKVFYHVVDTTQKDRLAETIDAVIAELTAPNPVEIDPIKTDEHFLIIGAHINEPIGCCTGDGKGDVLTEEPGATFQPVNEKECPICNEDVEPPAPAAMSAEGKPESFNIGDYVIDIHGNFREITADEMPDLPYEKIQRLATQEEIERRVPKTDMDAATFLIHAVSEIVDAMHSKTRVVSSSYIEDLLNRHGDLRAQEARSEGAREEMEKAIAFGTWLLGLSPVDRCTVHSSVGIGIFLKTPEELYDKFNRIYSSASQSPKQQ